MEEFRENILNWYQFKNTDDVLEIGDSGITKMLIRKCNKVMTVKKDIKTTEISRKFDYIIMIGIIGNIEEIFGERVKLSELVVFLEKYLKENGKFLIAVDNKFGLRYFAGNPENILNSRYKSLIGYSNEEEKIETFTKKSLKSKLENIGYHTNFYYPLPDYKLPNVIFSDKSLPKYNTIDKYVPYCKDGVKTVINEIDVFREILKEDENQFEFFANSFLVEASKVKTPIKYKYISFNNMRKPRYRLITKIADEYVEKETVNSDSEEHYNQIKNNIEILKNDKIKLLDDAVDGIIRSKYIEQKYMLSNVITELLEKNETKQVEKILKKYIDILNKNSYIEEDYEKTVFKRYGIKLENPELLKELHFKENGFWDMTFKNCFYVDDELYFFDQEWNEKFLPAEYILYHSIVYTISLRRFINVDDWLEKYDLIKYLKIFKELDDKLQEDVRDSKVWDFFHQNKYVDIDATIQELENMKIREKSQQEAYDNLKAEYDSYKKKVQNTKPYKIYKAVKNITKRKK